MIEKAILSTYFFHGAIFLNKFSSQNWHWRAGLSLQLSYICLYLMGNTARNLLQTIAPVSKSFVTFNHFCFLSLKHFHTYANQFKCYVSLLKSASSCKKTLSACGNGAGSVESVHQSSLTSTCSHRGGCTHEPRHKKTCHWRFGTRYHSDWPA